MYWETELEAKQTLAYYLLEYKRAKKDLRASRPKYDPDKWCAIRICMARIHGFICGIGCTHNHLRKELHTIYEKFEKNWEENHAG